MRGTGGKTAGKQEQKRAMKISFGEIINRRGGRGQTAWFGQPSAQQGLQQKSVKQRGPHFLYNNPGVDTAKNDVPKTLKDLNRGGGIGDDDRAQTLATITQR